LPLFSFGQAQNEQLFLLLPPFVVAVFAPPPPPPFLLFRPPPAGAGHRFRGRGGGELDHGLGNGHHLLFGHHGVCSLRAIGTGDGLDHGLQGSALHGRLGHLLGLIGGPQLVVDTREAVAIWRQSESAVGLDGRQGHGVPHVGHLGQNMARRRTGETLVQRHLGGQTHVVHVDGLLARMIGIHLGVVQNAGDVACIIKKTNIIK